MKTFGPIDPRSQQQLVNCVLAAVDTGAYELTRDSYDSGVIKEVHGVQAALMADHHPGYSMPIGGVLGLEHHIGPGMVGYDIGCGNLYAETDILSADLAGPGQLSRLMDEIFEVISFGVGRKNSEPIADHPVFDRIAHSPIKEQRALLGLAREQLGTVGSGNHYVDVFENLATGHIGIGVHFGSRGFGHRTASGFLAIASGHEFNQKVPEGEMDSAPLLLDVRTAAGQDYIEAMNIALEYAYAGREWVVDRIIRGILHTTPVWSVHNNHNEARWERHGDVSMWVHRKGATPAGPGVRGFVGSTMGEPSVIIEGVDSQESTEALRSSVHGAGRVMSRTQAAGKYRRRKLAFCRTQGCPLNGLAEPTAGAGDICPGCGQRYYIDRRDELVRPGLIDWEGAQAELRRGGIELRGGGADEAPGAYKRLNEVLDYHQGTINIVAQLRPLGVAMAGKEIHDPYKD
jgi:tRNA-splicing ligase RtcB